MLRVELFDFTDSPCEYFYVNWLIVHELVALSIDSCLVYKYVSIATQACNGSPNMLVDLENLPHE